jgi:Arc/MetJ-type ribon-helix-helix transcriptional regulator
MTAKTVGFAVAEEDEAGLKELVDHFGHGNRSEFLRVAMQRMRHELFAERMSRLQAEAREELGGRVVSRDEVDALVKRVLADSRPAHSA